MEVWGGSQPTARGVRMAGLDAWVYSKPFGNAGNGGDIYYASSCATGRINRLLLADVSGHGDAVAESAMALRKLMRRYVNFLDQSRFVRSLNQQFAAMSRAGNFATAIATTFFTPTRVLTVCNAGHPPPLLYRASTAAWSIMESDAEDVPAPRNIPLGITDIMDYEQFDVELEFGDLVLCYTDALVESYDRSGEMFGPDGLLRIVEGLKAAPGEAFIQVLLETIGACHPGNLRQDDVTVMLLQPVARPVNIPMRKRIGAFFRFLGTTVCAINPRAERPPLPDFNVPNFLGAVIPPLAKRWRPTRPLKANRPRRQSIS